jgi:hypothetical protein
MRENDMGKFENNMYSEFMVEGFKKSDRSLNKPPFSEVFLLGACFVARLPGINTLPLFSSKMYEMIATGELPTIPIGRAVRVSSNAIGEWVEEYEQQEEVSA